MKKADSLYRRARCPVEIADANGIRAAGLARIIQPFSATVEFSPHDAQRLSLGQYLDLSSETFPVGPLHTSAEVSSVNLSVDQNGRSVVSAVLEFANLGEVQQRALQNRLTAVRSLVVTFGLNFPIISEFADENISVVEAFSIEDVLAFFDSKDITVLLVGSERGAPQARDLLAKCRAEFPRSATQSIVLGVGDQVSLFQEFIDEDGLFYLSRGSLKEEDLLAIVKAAVSRVFSKLDEFPREGLQDEIVDFWAQMCSQTDLQEAGRFLIETIRALVRADVSRLVNYNAANELLVTQDRNSANESADSVASGLIGFVARTGLKVRIEKLSTDPRFDHEADHPDGSADARFMAMPLRDADGEIVAVATAVRGSEHPAFSLADERMFELLLRHSAPIMSALLAQERLQAVFLEQAQVPNSTHIFRKEALDFHSQDDSTGGEPLRDIPGWLRKSHWILIALLCAAIVYIAFAKIDDYATGTVFIRARNKIAVIATTEGIVRSVEVASGDSVRAGDVLITFENTPGTTSAEPLITPLLATASGTVDALHLRSGDRVNPRERIATIINETAGYDMIAFLPGTSATQLRPGMNLVLKLTGYPNSHEVITIEHVSQEIIGSREAAHYVDREGPDILVASPIVVVQARLQSLTFLSDQRSHAYREGMTGNAEVTIRSRAVISNLLPALKDILDR